jgi:hypothetical protein
VDKNEIYGPERNAERNEKATRDLICSSNEEEREMRGVGGRKNK